jgi:hypothetical protein
VGSASSRIPSTTELNSARDFAYYALYRSRARSSNLSCGSSVYIFSMTNFVDGDDTDLVVDQVNDAVIALTNAVTISIAS